jgi:exosome complex component CSL4
MTSSSPDAPPLPPPHIDVIDLPPALRQKVGLAVTPGDKLGLVGASSFSSRLVSGNGTYVRQGQIRASVVGTVVVVRASLSVRGGGDDANENDNIGGKNGGGGRRWIVSVVPSKRSSSSYDDDRRKRPRVGSMILGRVTRVIRLSHAFVDMIATIPENVTSNGEGKGGRQCGDMIVLPYREPYSGTLRLGEMRSGTSSIELRIEECVRPGDVLLARVHAMGEREYVLSTAESELGVVRAVCESSGMMMEAISWKEMRCPVTMAKEGRKVAKPRLG